MSTVEAHRQANPEPLAGPWKRTSASDGDWPTACYWD